MPIFRHQRANNNKLNSTRVNEKAHVCWRFVSLFLRSSSRRIARGKLRTALSCVNADDDPLRSSQQEVRRCAGRSENTLTRFSAENLCLFTLRDFTRARFTRVVVMMAKWPIRWKQGSKNGKNEENKICRLGKCHASKFYGGNWRRRLRVELGTSYWS